MESSFITMADILTHNIPFEPSIRTSEIASSTRDPTDTEKQYQWHEQLHGVVYDPDLVRQLVRPALAWAEGVAIDKKNEEHCYWRGRVDPKFTHHLLSPVINSEQDARAWWSNVLGRSSIGIIRAIVYKAVNLHQDPRECIPFIASSPGKKGYPTPDGLILKSLESWENLRDDGSEETECVTELKGPNAFPANIFINITATRCKQSSEPAVIIPFIWPEGESITKQTKILVQVWSQMYTQHVDYAILSSYHSTVFFHRGKSAGGLNILYISSTYSIRDVLPATFAWMAQAMHLIPKIALDLPKLDIFCMNETNQSKWWAARRNSGLLEVPCGLVTDFAKAYIQGTFLIDEITHQPPEPTTPRSTRKRKAPVSDDDNTPIAKRVSARLQARSDEDAQAGPSNYSSRKR